MGWLDVIWTGLLAANTAANISSAVSVNQMQKGVQQQQQEAYQRAEVLDLIDKISRRVKRLSTRLQNNPQAVLVISSIYDAGLRSMGITASQLHPEDRRYLRDLKDNLEDLIEDSRQKLSDEQIIQVGDCIQAISKLPEIESAISSYEMNKKNSTILQQWSNFLATTEDEWRALSAYQQKPKTQRTIGIIIVSIAGLLTCVNLAAVSTNVTFGGVVLLLLFVAAIAVGVYLIVKGKSPYDKRYKELQMQRVQAVNFINKNRNTTQVSSDLLGRSMDSLLEQRDKYNELVTSVLGEVGNIQKFLFSDD